MVEYYAYEKLLELSASIKVFYYLTKIPLLFRNNFQDIMLKSLWLSALLFFNRHKVYYY